MRVTENSRREQVLNNIQKTSSRLQEAQMQMATGQRLNRPSDDPVGAAMMQDIVTKISSNEQLILNLQDHRTWLERSELELNHIQEMMTQARTLAMSQSGSDANEESRQMTAREIAAIRESLFDAANSREGKLYLFSGVKTLTQPLEKNSPIQPAKIETKNIVQEDIREVLDVSQFRANFEGHSNNPYHLRVVRSGPFGQAQYQVSDDGGRTWGEPQVMRPSIAMYNPDSKPDDQVYLKISDQEGRLSKMISDYFDVDLKSTFDFTVNGEIIFPEGLEFVFQPNPEVGYHGSEDKKEVLIANGVSVPMGVTASEVLLESGDEKIDVFSLLSSIEKALIEDDGTTLAERLSELQKAQDQVLKRQADLGNLMREIEMAQAKLEDQAFEKEKRLSEVRDLDLAKAAVDVNSAEVNNRLALDSAGRLIQPTLSDFLR